MKKLSPSDHARRFAVGNQILEGPRSIFPPREIADYGWLEPSLLIILRKIDLTIFESIALFCDDSVNRESDFLSPIVRHVVWDKRGDEKYKSQYPNIKIDYRKILDWDSINKAGIRVQEALTKAPLSPYGHSIERGYPNLSYNEDGYRYHVSSTNGVQSIEFNSTELEEDLLLNALTDGKDVLINNSSSNNFHGWKEKYNYRVGKHPDYVYPQTWEWINDSPYFDEWTPQIINDEKNNS